MRHERCAHFVAVDLWDALWCQPGRRAAARRRAVEPPRLFRFVHHEMHVDSEEFLLLRARLRASGFVECASGDASAVTGEEDAVWMLGHPASLSAAALLFQTLGSRQDHGGERQSGSRFLVNAVPVATHLGDKDEMFANLKRLAGLVGDAAFAFVPRTWMPQDLASIATDDDPRKGGLRGIWVRKDPQKELGGGIALIDGSAVLATVTSPSSSPRADACERCLVQRYVSRPYLLDDRKFSFGVYTALLGLDPLTVFIHREMLVLLCSMPYAKDDVAEPLRHLSNGLLNRRRNPGEVPECDGCPYNVRPYTSDWFCFRGDYGSCHPALRLLAKAWAPLLSAQTFHAALDTSPLSSPAGERARVDYRPVVGLLARPRPGLATHRAPSSGHHHVCLHRCLRQTP